MWTQGVGMNGGAPVPEQRSVSGGVPEQPPGPDSERIAPADGTGTADASGARSPGSAMRYAVLGPVRAWRGGDRLAPGTPQQQALLAVLLLREGRTATAPELIDALWGEDPPSQALPAIRTYASRLRKVLDPGDLTSVSGGYALTVPHGALDLTVAQELAAEAEKAAGRLRRPVPGPRPAQQGARPVGRRGAGRRPGARTAAPSAPAWRSGGSASRRTCWRWTSNRAATPRPSRS
ncbi:hypothetical protein MTP02_22890 [Streptomyces albus]|nr:hypothetical protein MTP02_22890 [Streptomyces albus]